MRDFLCIFAGMNAMENKNRLATVTCIIGDH